MHDYLLLMHSDAHDATAANDPDCWARYLTRLQAGGLFDGGSSMGAGERHRLGSPAQALAPAWVGFVRVRAASQAEAAQHLLGNLVFEAGGTVDVLHLPRD